MNRRVFTSVLLVAAIMICSRAAIGQNTRQLTRVGSQDRVALVIGNAAYVKASQLTNPVNDASDMAAALKTLGFDVLSGTNLDKRQMETLIRQFGAKLSKGGTGLFYYAGHGLQVGGENYLVPVDADIPEETEVSYSAVSLGLVLSKMAASKNDLNIVILDACRNNPFARSWRGYRDIATSDGLAKISPPTGTLVLYATEPGKVASDGSGRNGLFTEALLRQMMRPDIEYDQLVKALSTDVWEHSNQKQLPWKEGNSLKDFYFLRSGGSIPTGTIANQPAGETKPASDYEIKNAEIGAKNKETDYKNQLIGKAFDAGIAAYTAKDYDTAINKFDEAFALDPTWPASAPRILRSKAIALRVRAIGRYNDGIKQPAGQLHDQTVFKSQQDLSLAFEALSKAVKILKGANPTAHDAGKIASDMFLSLTDIVECYRLMMLTHTPFPEGVDPQVYFDEYLATETDPAKKTKALETINTVRLIIDAGKSTGSKAKPDNTNAKTSKVVQGGELNSKAINLVKPAYPPAARATKASGVVTVEVVIDEDGNVVSARAVSGDALLRSVAEAAARASTFIPTMILGRPVRVSGVITYNFVP